MVASAGVNPLPAGWYTDLLAAIVPVVRSVVAKERSKKKGWIVDDREAIGTEIDRLRSLDLNELRALWRVTFRSYPPPAFTKDLMVGFLCWHIQERAFGGLDPETAKHIDGLARSCKRSDCFLTGPKLDFAEFMPRSKALP
jgi:Protein of unknown function (DUF2924)